MSREVIQEELHALFSQYSVPNNSFPSESLGRLQQTFVDLGGALEKEIQSKTLTDMVYIANRMESLEELFPQEITMPGMWLVGGGNGPEILEGVYQEIQKALVKIMEEMKSLEKEPLTTEDLGVLQGLAQEGSRLTKAMTERQEQKTRFRKFEQAIKILSPQDRRFLMDLLTSKLETVCRSQA